MRAILLTLLPALIATVAIWKINTKPASAAEIVFCGTRYGDFSLDGCYGWKGEGFVNNDSSQGTSGVGLMSFDGNGALKGSYSGVFLGTPVVKTYVGTYTVNINGTGSLKFTDNATSTATFDFVIVNGSNELFLVNTGQNVQQTLDMKKQ